MKEVAAHAFDKAEDEWYVEEPWCATRFFEEVQFDGAIHEPCCGMGRILHAAIHAGYRTSSSDIVQRWQGTYRHFRLQDWRTDHRIFDNIVTNPPFTPCNEAPFPFVEWALSHVRRKVALILPMKWLAGDARSRWLETKPLCDVYVMTPRPSMPPGEYIMAGNKPGGGKKDFAWFVFQLGYAGPPAIRWLHRDG